MASLPVVQSNNTRQTVRWPGTRSWAALWLLLAGQLVFAAVFIPPWQNPDEHAHFAVIRTLARRPGIDLANRQDVGIQAEILASMVEHNFWHAYSLLPPDPIPGAFGDLPDPLGDQSNGPPLYYFAAARLCRLVDVQSLLGQYYLVRIASLLISLMTFGLIIRAAREWFDDDVALCTGALVALVPQFALIGVAVSPDPLVFLAGAFVWWQAGRAFAGKGIALSLAMMIVATLVAVLSKQLGITLVIQTAMLGVLVALTSCWGRRVVAVTASVAVILRLAGVLRAVNLLGPERLETAHRYLTKLAWTGDPLPLNYVVTFTSRLFGTGYLSAGWVRFDPPGWILRTAALIFVFGVARGIFVSLSRQGDARIRLSALVAALFVVLQLAALYGTRYYLPDAGGAQGRFLFPAIGPFCALCALGLVRWTSLWIRGLVCCSVIGVLGILDLVAWVTTVVPAYAFWP